MDCATCQELFSASLDGEISVDELARVSRHLDQCARCREWADEAQALHRRLRVGAAPAIPDLTARLVRTTSPAAPPNRRLRILRAVLVLVALAQLALATPTLFFGGHHELAPQHAHHMGALQLALVAGFLSVAVRPRIALAGFLPLATVLVVAGAALALAGSADGHAPTLHEATHLAALLGLATAWLIQSSIRPFRPSGRRTRLELAA
jgi:predicted anti-sigma-YlaC factor YlaD